jgi:integrase
MLISLWLGILIIFRSARPSAKPVSAGSSEIAMKDSQPLLPPDLSHELHQAYLALGWSRSFQIRQIWRFWKDNSGFLDLNQKFINVCREIDVRIGGSVGPTKSRRSRFVPISDAILPMLRRLVQHRDPDDWLFLNPQIDFPYSRMTRSIRTACRRAGLEGHRITPHYFRHWYATQFWAEGGDPVVLMKCLGHREFRTTLKYYEHMDIEPLVRQRNVVSVGGGMEG